MQPFARTGIAVNVIGFAGGTYYDITPNINYVEGNFTLRLFYQIPVYRNVRGIQLATSQLIGTELKYLFNFN